MNRFVFFCLDIGPTRLRYFVTTVAFPKHSLRGHGWPMAQASESRNSGEGCEGGERLTEWPMHALPSRALASTSH